jgi:hypothetical protein
MNVIDLFAGAGGLSLGFRQEKFKIILSTDIDIDCKNSYQLNWPKSQYLCEDIRKILPKDLEHKLNGNKVEIIIGGPPCKGFSTIGARASSNELKRKEFDDRNVLFRDFVKILVARVLSLNFSIDGSLMRAHRRIHDCTGFRKADLRWQGDCLVFQSPFFVFAADRHFF